MIKLKNIIANNLGSETQCVDLLGYLMLLNKIESQLYFHLLQNGEKTVTKLKKDIDNINLLFYSNPISFPVSGVKGDNTI